MPLFRSLDKKFCFLTLGLFFGVILTYSNHFHNDFEFDDSHTVVDNPYIRNIRNIPKFFTNASMMSSLPANASYRPVFATSVALDYWLGSGLKPFVFHLSNFFWFLLQGLLMYLMFKKILDLTCKHEWNSYVSLIAVSWYLLHPVNAETINYISARSDSYSTFCIIAGFVLYQYFPRGRKFGIYLFPILIGALTKVTAVVFAPLLFIYIFVFETGSAHPTTGLSGQKKKVFPAMIQAAWHSLPAWATCLALLVWIGIMTPTTFSPHGLFSGWNYLITQPFVIFRYFRTFFLPWGLSADSDWGVFDSLQDDRVWAGLLFGAVLLSYSIFKCRGIYRPVSFGLLWFFVALLPTSSFYPLAEVTNDHRMFFPFVGLVLSVCWSLRIVFVKNQSTVFRKKGHRISLGLVALYILVLYSYETTQRNIVWHTQESLWYDVTLKSPHNGRGLMNYGLAQMAKGRYDVALDYFERALNYAPHYAYLQINLGILKNQLNQKVEAENHFRSALQDAPQFDGGYYYYANWLDGQNRGDEAIPLLQKAIQLGPSLEARHLLMKLYFQRSEWGTLSSLVADTRKLMPNDSVSLQYLESIREKTRHK